MDLAWLIACYVVNIVGAQWGDEGKGKLVHLLSQHFDYVLRYQGGDNAGHTVQCDGQTYKFTVLPSGIIMKHLQCILCSGVVVNPISLVEQLQMLIGRSMWHNNLWVSHRASIIVPFNLVQDAYFEESKGADAIGTTRKGIGPTYADRCFRVGLMMGDMLKPGLRDKIMALGNRKNMLFGRYYSRPEVDLDLVWSQVQGTMEMVGPLITDTTYLVRKAIASKAKLLLEGAQGTLLDIDYGNYPFATSSHPTVGGAFLGTGVNYTELDYAMGVAKAYTTRVGAGPFPTEDFGEEGQLMGKRGAEIGTVTGRIRRCGPLDLCILRYAQQLNGFRGVVLTKADVLDVLPEIRVCVAYELNGRRVEWLDPDPDVMACYKPVYEVLPGWQCDTTGITNEDDLPTNLRGYVEFVKKNAGVDVRGLSLGPDRDQTVWLNKAA